MNRYADRRGRMRTELRASLVILAAIAVLPAIVVNEYWRGVVIVSMYFAMLAISWNLLAGYSGQFSLAPATFGMIGAYATGLLAYHFGAGALAGIPAAIFVAGLIGFAHFSGAAPDSTYVPAHVENGKLVPGVER